MSRRIHASGGPRKILVVEDDPEMFLYLHQVLEKAGYLVSAAMTGKAASAWLAQAVKPDLVVLDPTLPDEDGFKLCETIKKDPYTRAIPVVILTAQMDNLSRVKGSRALAELYLNKPIKHEDLVTAVQAVLERSGLREGRGGPLLLSGLELDPGRRVVSWRDRSLELSSRLFDLLYLLAESHPHVLNRRQIVGRLCPTARDRETDALVSLLRARMRRAFGAAFVATAYGNGYRLELPLPPVQTH